MSKFIVFEGIEGAGKSTIIKALQRDLMRHNQEVVVTREPGGTLLADQIRSLLLRSDLASMHENTELCLLAASRSEHVQTVIKPAIAAKKWVICDRFADSSLAYQGYGRGIDKDFIKSINALVCDQVLPDVVIICDISVELSLKRIKKRSKDRIEAESNEFFEKVRRGYLDIAKTDSRYRVIDASLRLEEVLKQVYLQLEL